MRKATKTDVVKSLTKDFVGYGHYRLNVEVSDDRILSAATGDSELISNLDSLIDSEREKARGGAIDFVMACNK